MEVASEHPTSDLTHALSNAPHSFLQPSSDLHASAVELAKKYLDPLASSISSSQYQRQQTARRKRKRGEEDEGHNKRLLQLNKLYIDGLDAEQVWGQARLVLDAAREELAKNKTQLVHELKVNGRAKEKNPGIRESSESDSEAAEDDEGVHSDAFISDEEDASLEDGVSPLELEDAEDISGEDEEMGDVEDVEPIEEDDGDEASSGTLVEDAFGLNDGFFSVDGFNKQAVLLENRDELNDEGDSSDEDEIDWSADAMRTAENSEARPNIAPNKKALPKNKANKDVDTDDEDDDDDGPTFGDPDALSEDGEEHDGDMLANTGAAGLGGMENTNELGYGGFFVPPARKAKDGPNTKKAQHNMPTKRPAPANVPREDDVQRTINAVRRDLFEDDLSAAENESAPDDEPNDNTTPRSTYERRQAKLAAEIRRLEAANVAKKEWTLSGEARAVDRPLNSLLEEDLDFERTGKPVPVITAEISESIEEMIKRRIITQEFDDLIRRRPDTILDPSEKIRRGRFELDDNKAQQSLAQIYEEEHLRRVDPEGHPDQRNEKLRKEHEEIEALWKDVSAKLDALSNWHYRPKPAKPAINIVADVPTIAMEDARPTATVGSSGVGTLARSSMLAPQEIYTPGKQHSGGKGGKNEVVVPKGSHVPVAVEEMTREEKVRRRRRNKERLRKKLISSGEVQGDGGGEKGNGKGNDGNKKAQDRATVLGDLKRGGVKVINRKGEVTDIQGGVVRDGSKRVTVGSHYKL
ncbi:MAG: hypothetical protein M1823_001421 [Watsoniomyces obsoletus]|nr:MAG: hypothetical protein M1823_001421 [Watsoniomyces obsoletus]